MYAYRRQAQIAGRTADHEKLYLQQKGRLLAQIQKQVDRHGPAIDSGTLVAVAILAVNHLQDGEVPAAATHISVLRALKALERLQAHQWLIVAWLDLRLALNLTQRPLFDLYIPLAYRGLPQWQVDNAARARTLATDCSRHSPTSIEAGFGPAQSLHLFNKLFLLFLAWPTLEATTSPPYGHIYELEYLIRSHHPQVVHHGIGIDATHTELLLLSMQLNLWILCRLWTPVQQTARANVLDRGLKLIKDMPDISTLWRSKQNASVLWILATFTACEEADRSTSIARPNLELCMKNLNIVKDHLAKILGQWPWMQDVSRNMWRCSLNEDESLTVEVAADSWCIEDGSLPIRLNSEIAGSRGIMPE